jgi:hypothetical protein
MYEEGKEHELERDEETIISVIFSTSSLFFVSLYFI